MLIVVVVTFVFAVLVASGLTVASYLSKRKVSLEHQLKRLLASGRWTTEKYATTFDDPASKFHFHDNEIVELRRARKEWWVYVGDVHQETSSLEKALSKGLARKIDGTVTEELAEELQDMLFDV